MTSHSALNLTKTSFFTLLAIVLFSLYVMGTMPLQDPSEGRHAVVAQNMLTSGDWITPMTTEDGEVTPFLGKPPLQFWLISSSIYLFGHNEFASRLPSLLETALAMFVLFRFATLFLTAEIGIAAIFIHLSSLLGFFFSGACMLDPLLAACVLISVLAIPMSAQLYRRGEESAATFWEIAGFVALAGGLLCKGPIALILTVGSLAPWIALSRPWAALRRIRWIRGAGVTTALAAPWYILADIQQPGFLNYFIVHENILRFLVKKYGDRYGSGHQHFRGMIWFMTLFACVPWVLIGVALLGLRTVCTIRYRLFSLPPTPISQPEVQPSRRVIPEAIQVALGLALFPALFFTASRQVSIYYTLPSVPALSLLLAYWITRVWEKDGGVIRWICAGIRILTIIGIPAVAVFSWVRRPDPLFTAIVLLPIGFVVLFELLTIHQRSINTTAHTISRTAFFLVSFYLAGALLQLTDYVGGASCRDLIASISAHGAVDKISFFEKVPHSALFYSAVLGDTITKRKITIDEMSDLSEAQTLRNPFVIRQKALKKLAKMKSAPHFNGRRIDVAEGGWVVFLPELHSEISKQNLTDNNS